MIRLRDPGQHASTVCVSTAWIRRCRLSLAATPARFAARRAQAGSDVTSPTGGLLIVDALTGELSSLEPDYSGARALCLRRLLCVRNSRVFDTRVEYMCDIIFYAVSTSEYRTTTGAQCGVNVHGTCSYDTQDKDDVAEVEIDSWTARVEGSQDGWRGTHWQRPDSVERIYSNLRLIL
jgi:hypothetical protein